MLTNPLCEVKLDTRTHQASFTWDAMANMMEEVELGRTEYETDNMVRQIDNMTEVKGEGEC